MPWVTSRLWAEYEIGMLRVARARLLPLVLIGMGLAASCGDPVEEQPPTELTCDATVSSATYEVVPVEDTRIFLDLPEGHERDILQRDIVDVLERLWGSEPTVVFGAPDGSTPAPLWISASEQARSASGAKLEKGYALARSGGGLVAYGTDGYHASVAAYALLEELGARFFHPMEDLVPALGEARFPAELAVERAPAFETRGVQLHTLHPIEYLEPLTVPGEQNLAVARKLIDWLVKTGHDQIQWWILEERANGWEEHTRAIIEYAHVRGVKVGALVQLSKAASFQRAFGLVEDEATQAEGEAQIRERLDEVLGAGWDHIELTLGEFLASDPDLLIAWLNTATDHLMTQEPPVEVSVVNHVGGDLYVDYEGESVFFYFLPQFADPRLTNSVHTVFFFDLYREWGGYGHDDFFAHREYLFDHLGERKMRYIPESAYWASADVDVPLFLPTYLTGRWMDVKGIALEPKQMGLPPVEGHIMFSSGHEWGYWMTDYLTAKMLWRPGEPLENLVREMTASFGSCSEQLATGLLELVALQDEFLFDKKLVGYLSGEDLADDAGAAGGILTTPRRRAYEEVAALTGADRAAFEADVVSQLERFADAEDEVTARLEAACERPDERSANFCHELADGSAITALRARHSALLYRAVLAADDKDVARPLIAEATLTRAKAASVIGRRESGYRFAAAKLVEKLDNPTIYDWGYLRQAHLLCYWDRQALQAENWVEYQSTGFVGLPTCSE